MSCAQCRDDDDKREVLFTIKQGGRLPSFEVEVGSDAPFDLNDADFVTFAYRRLQPNGKPLDERLTVTAVVTSANTVRIDWGSQDTADASLREFQIEASYGGKLMIFPDDGWYLWEVSPTIVVT